MQRDLKNTAHMSELGTHHFTNKGSKPFIIIDIILYLLHEVICMFGDQCGCVQVRMASIDR
jgi:hypothetical protein